MELDEGHPLGQGQSAVVYRASFKDLWRGDCAAKVVRAGDEAKRGPDLLAELGVLAAIRAKGVRHCLQPFDTQLHTHCGRPALLLPLLDGFELEAALTGRLQGPQHHRTASGRVRSDAAARWAVQLDEFAADMRRAGAWHGDLKAKNIQIVNSFVRGEAALGDVRVLDFAGGGSGLPACAAAAAAEHPDAKRARQLLAQLEWQCSEHEACVVWALQGQQSHHLPGELEAQISRGWQLVPAINTLAEEPPARDTFLQHDAVAKQTIEPAGVDQDADTYWDALFDHLLHHYLGNPAAVYEKAGIPTAACTRSAEQLVAEGDERAEFQSAYTRLQSAATEHPRVVLYGAGYSVYTRIVQLVLVECGVPYELVEVRLLRGIVGLLRCDAGRCQSSARHGSSSSRFLSVCMYMTYGHLSITDRHL